RPRRPNRPRKRCPEPGSRDPCPRDGSRGSTADTRAARRARWCSPRSRTAPSPESWRMRVQVVDPPAYTPPYDRSLCAALARAGADVELVTSHFVHGTVPAPMGYEVREAFYRRSNRREADTPARRALKLAEHVKDMARHR